MKVILSIVAFACFAVMYGVALLTTSRSERAVSVDLPADDGD